jgi:hypothetical protein
LNCRIATELGCGARAIGVKAKSTGLIAWVEEGEITDVKTTISAYWLDRYRQGLVTPEPI